MGLAIVAIPEEQDRVWKISSEKVPHLTLLFLGDENNSKLEQIMQFVEHAVTLSEHGQFYLDVDHRGELGADSADVIFFSKRSCNLKWIKQFRAQLLQNTDIKTAYDSTQQFTVPQDWVPHLTLGYPKTPAQPQQGDNDYPLYSVCFDRIAVWAGAFDGPEFRLEWPDREFNQFGGDLALAYADEQKRAIKHKAFNSDQGQTATAILERGEQVVHEHLGTTSDSTVEHGEAFAQGLVHGAPSSGEQFILEHHGVKGMRWGTRGSGSSSAFSRFRRQPPQAVAPQATSKVPHGKKRKTKVETDGGENHPATQDALRVAEAQAKLKKSGPKALTNDELREVATRVQLEQQAVQATRSGTNKFARETISNQGKQAVNQIIKSKIDKKIKSK